MMLTIPEITPLIFWATLLKAPFIFSLKLSEVVYKYTNPAVSAAIDAIIMVTGFTNPSIVEPKLLNELIDDGNTACKLVIIPDPSFTPEKNVVKAVHALDIDEPSLGNRAEKETRSPLPSAIPEKNTDIPVDKVLIAPELAVNATAVLKPTKAAAKLPTIATKLSQSVRLLAIIPVTSAIGCKNSSIALLIVFLF